MIEKGQFNRENVERAIRKIESLSDEDLLFITIWYYYGMSFNAGDEYIEIYEKFHDTFEIPFNIGFDDLFSRFFTENILEGDGGSEYLSEIYTAAFEKCLQENKRINDFFSKIILSKAEIDRGYQHDKMCPGIITKNFNVLPKEVRELFIKAADDEDVDIKCMIARSIIWDYCSLPTDVQDLILKRLIYDNELIREAISDTVNYRFRTLPKEFREKVIMELGYPLKIITEHFNELPVDFQNQFKKRIQASFKKGFFRFGNASIRSKAIYAIVGSFENLPEDVQKMLWLFIDDSSANVRSDLGRILETNFDKLPANMCEEILRKFSVDKNYEVRRSIISVIIRHFEKLPDDINDSLEKLAVDNNVWVRSLVAYSLNYLDHNNNIPPGLRGRLLIKLVKDDDLFVRDNAASSIVRNYGILQKETHDLFLELATTGDLEVRKSIAYAVAYYYDIEETRFLIDKLMPELEEKIGNFVKNGLSEDREKVISILENTKDKIRKEYAIELLDKLSRDDDEYIRKRAIEINKLNIG